MRGTSKAMTQVLGLSLSVLRLSHPMATSCQHLRGALAFCAVRVCARLHRTAPTQLRSLCCVVFLSDQVPRPGPISMFIPVYV